MVCCGVPSGSDTGGCGAAAATVVVIVADAVFVDVVVAVADSFCFSSTPFGNLLTHCFAELMSFAHDSIEVEKQVSGLEGLQHHTRYVVFQSVAFSPLVRLC